MSLISGNLLSSTSSNQKGKITSPSSNRTLDADFSAEIDAEDLKKLIQIEKKNVDQRTQGVDILAINDVEHGTVKKPPLHAAFSHDGSNKELRATTKLLEDMDAIQLQTALQIMESIVHNFTVESYYIGADKLFIKNAEDRFMEFDHHRIIFIPSTGRT